eukprot:gene40754-49701_t
MINIYIAFVAPLVVPYVLFYVYIYLGGNLTISKVYTIQALLNVVRLPFSITPMAWANYQEAHVAMDRLGEFLLLEEVSDSYGCKRVEYDREDGRNKDAGKECDVEMVEIVDSELNISNQRRNSEALFDLQNASFSYKHADVLSASSPPATLQNINLVIYPGELVGVIGGVGSGKTSLLAALLGEMHQVGGTMESSSPRIAYVAQEHWICNSSVIDNILFYTALDEDKYRQVIESSQLLADLLVLPHADYTSIGERGVNLSGGQKARVSVARALYAGTKGESGSECDLYIFDDPLASVDVHVGKALFNRALVSPLLQKKARILVLSSNYHLLPLFDKVAVLKNGHIESFGNWSDIRAKHPEYNVTAIEEDNVAVGKVEANPDGESVGICHKDSVVYTAQCVTDTSSRVLPVQKFSLHADTITSRRAHAAELHSTEERERGAVALQTYLAYFSFALAFVRRSSSSRIKETDLSLDVGNHKAIESGKYLVEDDHLVVKKSGNVTPTEAYSGRDLGI